MEMNKRCLHSARSRQWIWKLKIVKVDVDSWQKSRNYYYVWGLAMPSKENVSAFRGTHTKRENVVLLLLIRIGEW